MEILSNHNRQELLDYLPHIKSSQKEWQIVEIRLVGNAANFTTADAAKITHTLLENKEGKIYICNDRDVLALVRWGKVENNPTVIADIIAKELPERSCKVAVHEATPEGFAKLVLFIGPPKSTTSEFANVRYTRKENVVLVADDDMYVRMLVKKGMPVGITVYETADGNEVIESYKKYNPDMVFLDIHLPGKDGTELLKEILALDKDAHVVMLSADSSRENVQFTASLGTKGFLTKPFTKERLLEYVNQCPTISQAA